MNHIKRSHRVTAKISDHAMLDVCQRLINVRSRDGDGSARARWNAHTCTRSNSNLSFLQIGKEILLWNICCSAMVLMVAEPHVGSVGFILQSTPQLQSHASHRHHVAARFQTG